MSTAAVVKEKFRALLIKGRAFCFTAALKERGSALKIHDRIAFFLVLDNLRAYIRMVGTVWYCWNGDAMQYEPLVMTVDEVAAALGICRNSAYKAVEDGTVPSLRVGRRRIVPKQRFVEWLNAAGDEVEAA
jgi:excisionase family DNA binding protein